MISCQFSLTAIFSCFIFLLVSVSAIVIGIVVMVAVLLAIVIFVKRARRTFRLGDIEFIAEDSIFDECYSNYYEVR